MILAYITCKDGEQADSIGRVLLDKKLAGCVNIFPIASMYLWKGKIGEGSEVVLLAKTTEAKYNDVVKEVERVHSYDIPCIMKIPVACNKKYKDWLESEIK